MGVAPSGSIPDTTVLSESDKDRAEWSSGSSPASLAGGRWFDSTLCNLEKGNNVC